MRNSLVVCPTNLDGFVFFLTSGDVALLRLYNPSELMGQTTSTDLLEIWQPLSTIEAFIL
ncbi:MAG: hypothetical protein AAF757_10075 [Cyanobacteria bacterium P01_D01_bin.116]